MKLLQGLLCYLRLAVSNSPTKEQAGWNWLGGCGREESFLVRTGWMWSTRHGRVKSYHHNSHRQGRNKHSHAAACHDARSLAFPLFYFISINSQDAPLQTCPQATLIEVLRGCLLSWLEFVSSWQNLASFCPNVIEELDIYDTHQVSGNSITML